MRVARNAGDGDSEKETSPGGAAACVAPQRNAGQFHIGPETGGDPMQRMTKGRPASDVMRLATGDEAEIAEPGATVRVWDPLTRVFHWSLVLTMLAAYETPSMDDAIHARAGYAAAGLVALRVVWGLAGPRYARFSNFVKRPLTVFAYMRDIVRRTATRHLGHNPAGGAMVVALILSVLTTAVTGFLMYTSAYQYGDDTIPRLHILAANATLVLVAIHLTGVGVVSLLQRENLVVSMFTGRKRRAGPDDID